MSTLAISNVLVNLLTSTFIKKIHLNLDNNSTIVIKEQSMNEESLTSMCTGRIKQNVKTRHQVSTYTT